MKKVKLLIIGRKEECQGAKYISARLITDGKFCCNYGKLEARNKLSAGQGIWPAFWILGQSIHQNGSPKCGEIDILEHVNTENIIHCTFHWDYNGLISFGGTVFCDVT